MDKKNTISIIVASDNHYAILIAALLKSIDVNHHTEEHIDFYIIDDGISAKFKRQLMGVVASERISIKWIDANTMVPEGFSIPIDNSAFPRTTYLRVFSPYVLDKELERLIYLDVDTIVQGDISGLWHTPLGNNVIAAAIDVGKTLDCAWGGVPNFAELGLTADTKYFNAGVLLIDLVKWRRDDISAKVVKALHDHKRHVRLADQYGLNVVLANRWEVLDPRWNWFAFADHDQPFLVHFLDVKPIFTTYHSHEKWRSEFFRYLALTPWKDFKPINGNRRVFRKAYNKIKKRLMKLIGA